MGSLKEKAKALLQQCEVVTLTSINKEGYPRPVPLSKIKTEGLTTIWFATGNSSAKTKDFRSNPKAGICFYKEGNSVAMTGEVEVVSDTGTKKELWQDWFIHHFPKGPEDPEYILKHLFLSFFFVNELQIHNFSIPSPELLINL